MCSSTCAIPVLPLTSSMLPTLYQSMATTTGARRSGLTMTRRPLSSLRSAVEVGVVAAAAAHGAAEAASASSRHERNKRQRTDFTGSDFGRGGIRARIVSNSGGSSAILLGDALVNLSFRP